MTEPLGWIGEKNPSAAFFPMLVPDGREEEMPRAVFP
jgi:hypothetical protein